MYRIQIDIFGGATLYIETEDGLQKIREYKSERAAITARDRLERGAGQQENLFSQPNANGRGEG
jgi:hypothetical protein